MAPKRQAAAAAGSASEASDAEAHASHHISSASQSKTPPPNPNPKSAPADPAPAAEDSAAAGSDSGAAYDSEDADHRPAPPKPAASPSRTAARMSPEQRSRSRSPTPEANSDSDGSALPAASDADPAAGDGADSDDDGNASPLPPPRPSRADAAAIKPLSSRPMDPPRRSVNSFSEPRAKRPRSAAIPAAVEQLKRPSRLWSPADELVILRGLAAYRNKRGALPGSVHDIGKLHSQIRNELSVKVTTTQLSDKVRRLKQKYHLLATRTKNGRDPDFPTPQDQSVYELGKKLWGASAGAGGGSAVVPYENTDGGDSDEERHSGDSDDSVRDDRDHRNKRFKPVAMSNGNGTRFGATSASRGKAGFEKGKDAYPFLWETIEDLSRQHPNGVVFKKAFEMIEGPKARGMEEKLSKFRVAEVRHQLRRMELMKETVKMVLDALEG